MTISDLSDFYFTEIIPQLEITERGVIDKKQHIKRIKERLGDLDVSVVRTREIQLYVWDRQKESKDGARAECNTLSQMFKWGKRMGLIDGENPVTDVQRPRCPPRDRYVTDDELKMFCDIDRNWSGPIAKLAYATGLRKGDLLRLVYQPDELVLKTRKTGRKMAIVVTPDLDELIKQVRWDVKEGEVIILNRHGKPYDESSFNTVWYRRMNWFVERGGERFRLHDLRAKFVTDSEKAGLDPQKQAGHESANTTKIYLRSRETVLVTPMLLG